MPNKEMKTIKFPNNDTIYEIVDAVSRSNIETLKNEKQDNLVSGTNIKTINGKAILGNGNIQIDVPTKVSQLTNDSGYITASVNNLSNYYTRSEVDGKINSIYKFKGTCSYSELIAKTDASIGDVWNVSDKGGMNYACIIAKTAGASSWDELGTNIDLSDYYTKSQVNDLIPKTSYVMNSKNYPVKLDSNSNMYVNVPWTDTDTIYNHPSTHPASMISGLSKVATSGSYTDLTNTPSIPTVNNATITINQNGTLKGSFTLNQSGNTTISLTDTDTNTAHTHDAGGGLVINGTGGDSGNTRYSIANFSSDIAEWASSSVNTLPTKFGIAGDLGIYNVSFSSSGEGKANIVIDGDVYVNEGQHKVSIEGHNHNGAYYIKSEVDKKLEGKANTNGTYSSMTVGNATNAKNADSCKSAVDVVNGERLEFAYHRELSDLTWFAAWQRNSSNNNIPELCAISKDNIKSVLGINQKTNSIPVSQFPNRPSGDSEYGYAFCNNPNIAANQDDYLLFVDSNQSAYFGTCLNAESQVTWHKLATEDQVNSKLGKTETAASSNGHIVAEHGNEMNVYGSNTSYAWLNYRGGCSTVKIGNGDGNNGDLGSIEANQFIGTARNAQALENHPASYFATAGHNHDLVYAKLHSSPTFADCTLTGNLYLSSDRRVKENIEKVNESLLNKIKKLDIFKYNYKNSDEKQIGVMAQDLEEILPELKDELITIKDDSENTGISDRRYIKENKLVYILWKAVQELMSKVEYLEKEIMNKEE